MIVVIIQERKSGLGLVHVCMIGYRGRHHHDDYYDDGDDDDDDGDGDDDGDDDDDDGGGGDDDGDGDDDDIWKLGRTRMTKPSSSLKPYSSSSLMYSSLSNLWFPFSEKCTLRVRLVM